MADESEIFSLPANAPRACPACGGPWSRGYIVRKLAASLGGRGKKVYKWALECRDEDCGLGYFIGSEIEYEDTEGLELITRERRKQEVAKMAEEKKEKDKRPAGDNGWGGKYPACQNCGTTERRHQARGLCTACYSRLHYQKGKQRSAAAPAKPRKARGAAAPARKAGARAKGDGLTITVTVNYDDLPIYAQAEIKERAAAIIAEKALARL